MSDEQRSHRWSGVERRLGRGRDEAGAAVRSLTPVRYVQVPRRWPWALGAAVAGAAVGAALVVLLRRFVGQDAPDAQEPGELRAVIDPDPATGTPAA